MSGEKCHSAVLISMSELFCYESFVCYNMTRNNKFVMLISQLKFLKEFEPFSLQTCFAELLFSAN